MSSTVVSADREDVITMPVQLLRQPLRQEQKEFSYTTFTNLHQHHSLTPPLISSPSITLPSPISLNSLNSSTTFNSIDSNISDELWFDSSPIEPLSPSNDNKYCNYNKTGEEDEYINNKREDVVSSFNKEISSPQPLKVIDSSNLMRVQALNNPNSPPSSLIPTQTSSSHHHQRSINSQSIQQLQKIQQSFPNISNISNNLSIPNASSMSNGHHHDIHNVPRNFNSHNIHNIHNVHIIHNSVPSSSGGYGGNSLTNKLLECDQCIQAISSPSPSPSINSNTFSSKNKFEINNKNNKKINNLMVINDYVNTTNTKKRRQTPAWRRDLQGEALLCNACGLYLKVKNCQRPTELGPDGEIRLVKIERPGNGQPKCSNCNTTDTPCWRGPEGGKLCNKCGLYLKQHGNQRPISSNRRM
ncbi:7857_t:CDS:2 [Diversispora eburnea]|uniref:7857_t:CDS:1 n=1 Tax=Diversispora eburnea TaxID=1213867 RepID=A0A9N8WJV4_9GLOM|nr:7857_t:CDS:2 [Diversispora eburnea]